MHASEVIYGVIIACLLFSILVAVLVSFMYIYLKNKRKYLEEKQSIELKHQQAILQSEIEIQEQTLKQIASELHDNIGQVLTVAKIQLNQYLQQQQDAVIVKAHESTSVALDLLRKLSKSLNTNYLDHATLDDLIKKNLEQIQEIGGFNTQIEIQGNALSIDNKNKLVIYRCVQEILTNALKHAKCFNLKISMVYTEDQLTIDIVDDGVGLNTDLFYTGHATNEGSGLGHIRQRMFLIGGEANVTSVQQKGSHFNIVFPK